MASLRLLSVCTHNRTRSVVMGAMLTRHLAGAGVDGGVRAAGFDESGHPPTAYAVQYLADIDIDISGYRSRRITADDVARADLIVTAERMHVVEIAARFPGAFDRTMTLPEVVRYGHEIDVHGDMSSWLREVAARRPHDLDYLDADIDEIPDPTGESPAMWRSTVATIDQLTYDLAHILATRVHGARPV